MFMPTSRYTFVLQIIVYTVFSYYIDRSIKTTIAMMNEQVRRIMTTDHMTVNPGQSIQEVTELMQQKKIQQIPVVEAGKLVGLVTSYDLWKKTKQQTTENQQTVQDVMTTNVLTISPLDKVGTAAQLFADKRFKTLPVVNLDNDLKGVVTAFDVIRQAYLSEFPEPSLYKKEFIRSEE